MLPLRCRFCWWKENARCYNEKFAMIEKHGSSQEGELIDEELVGACKRQNGFEDKKKYM